MDNLVFAVAEGIQRVLTALVPGKFDAGSVPGAVQFKTEISKIGLCRFRVRFNFARPSTCGGLGWEEKTKVNAQWKLMALVHRHFKILRYGLAR